MLVAMIGIRRESSTFLPSPGDGRLSSPARLGSKECQGYWSSRNALLHALTG